MLPEPRRIVVAQRDEIGFMQRWLRERHLPLPDGDASHDMMPGMLTAEQLRQLDAARGPEFDRLFLTFMIMHHQGAITMVHQLLDAPGALRDDAMFKFASNINADQTAEIDRMTRRLEAMGRSQALAADRVSAARTELAGAEKLSSQARRDALTQLATELDGEAAGASDRAKVHTLVSAIRDLASGQR
jgi:hypothetical protein